MCPHTGLFVHPTRVSSPYDTHADSSSKPGSEAITTAFAVSDRSSVGKVKKALKITTRIETKASRTMPFAYASEVTADEIVEVFDDPEAEKNSTIPAPTRRAH